MSSRLNFWIYIIQSADCKLSTDTRKFQVLVSGPIPSPAELAATTLTNNSKYASPNLGIILNSLVHVNKRINLLGLELLTKQNAKPNRLLFCLHSVAHFQSNFVMEVAAILAGEGIASANLRV